MVALKTLIFSILVPGTVTVIIPWLLLQGTGGLILPIPSLWMFGLLPPAVGAGLSVWCAGAFTLIVRGTPAPIDAPRVFVTQGAYRWMRNPMYVAVLFVVIGEAILFRSLLLAGYALLLLAAFHAFVIFCEEPSLCRCAANLERAMKHMCTPFHDGFLASHKDDATSKPCLHTPLVPSSARLR